MKNLFFVFLICSVFLISCSEDDIINNDIIDDLGGNTLDGESSTIIKNQVQYLVNGCSILIQVGVAVTNTDLEVES